MCQYETKNTYQTRLTDTDYDVIAHTLNIFRRGFDTSGWQCCVLNSTSWGAIAKDYATLVSHSLLYISNFASGVSPECWRQCGGLGTLMHRLWSCPHITSYCLNIFTLIEQILGFPISPSPDMALLSLEIDNIFPALRTVTSHIFLAARLCLVHHWKKILLPDMKEILQTINLTAHMRYFSHTVQVTPQL